MSKFIAFVLMICSLNALAQLSDFESNVTAEESKQSLVRENFVSRYDYILSFHQSSHWHEDEIYYVFGYTGREWRLIRWTFVRGDHNRPVHQREKRMKYSSRKFEDLLDAMSQTGFYELKHGALNLRQRDNGDGTGVTMHIYDGVTDEFELISPVAHRISTTYAENSLQEKFPTVDRRDFIHCRDMVLDLVFGRD
ncbi:hypothetical protein BFP72_10470 [Reichenbachiella sp. 5M10]|uniref:hypothetical protein n=1 Tax=Reichenbachiella sp. 5M10 TaxID=1889772 RepID=UPI000C15D32E|nr:hypothetical protein [Reichenbachiella sp. 5M10]PIB35787.1 hypothetical protein BFP72_10470 [Reichenbachiella sp. 5M10]